MMKCYYVKLFDHFENHFDRKTLKKLSLNAFRFILLDADDIHSKNLTVVFCL